MTHQDQWTAGERAAFLQTVTWVPNVAMRLICERLNRAVQLLAPDQGESASEAFVAVLSAQSVANMWSTQAALADREQPGTDDGNAGGSEQKSLSGEAGWIDWRGGENPVPGQRVEVRFRRDAATGEAQSDCYWGWQHRGVSHDIIAYRIAPSSQGGEGGADA